MSLHSYSRCWLHLVWATLNREKLLNNENARNKLSQYLYEYSKTKTIFMKINHVNNDHVHTLIDLPTKYSIEEVMHLLKGSSSHWINENDLIATKFSWGRGYGAFSVSESDVPNLIKYIENQDEHHKRKMFNEEYEYFIKTYGLKFIQE